MCECVLYVRVFSVRVCMCVCVCVRMCECECVSAEMNTDSCSEFDGGDEAKFSLIQTRCGWNLK